MTSRSSKPTATGSRMWTAPHDCFTDRSVASDTTHSSGPSPPARYRPQIGRVSSTSSRSELDWRRVDVNSASDRQAPMQVPVIWGEDR